MYYGYAVAINPAAGYAAQYQASLLKELEKKLGAMQREALKDDYERAHEALIKGDTEKAIRYLERESHLGVSKAAKDLGDLYHFKLKDLPKALMFYKKACELGDIESGALVYVAKYHLDKLTKNELPPENDSLFENPWLKYVLACIESDELLKLGSESTQDWQRTLNRLEEISGEEIPHAQTRAGHIYKLIGATKSAEDSFRAAAGQGYCPAIGNLVNLKIENGAIEEAAEEIINWENKFAWDAEVNYDIMTFLRIFYLMPVNSSGKAEKTKQAINIANLLWSGNRAFVTEWDAYAIEISRTEHGQSQGQWGWLFQEQFKEAGKKPYVLVQRQAQMLLYSFFDRITNWKEESKNYRSYWDNLLLVQMKSIEKVTFNGDIPSPCLVLYNFFLLMRGHENSFEEIFDRLQSAFTDDESAKVYVKFYKDYFDKQ